MDKRCLITGCNGQELIQEFINYDPDTGEFIWKKSCGRSPKNSKAGFYNDQGYILIGHIN